MRAYAATCDNAVTTSLYFSSCSRSKFIVKILFMVLKPGNCVKKVVCPVRSIEDVRIIFNNQYIADNLLNNFHSNLTGDGGWVSISGILIGTTAHCAGREAQVQ